MTGMGHQRCFEPAPATSVITQIATKMAPRHNVEEGHVLHFAMRRNAGLFRTGDQDVHA